MVRNAEGRRLARTLASQNPTGYAWVTYGDVLTSRSEAERLAAEHGNTVVEIETIERVRGLRRERRGSDFQLFDGADTRAFVACEWVAAAHDDGTKSEPWLARCWFALSNRSRSTVVEADGKTADEVIDEAKTAAEASVRGAWS